MTSTNVPVPPDQFATAIADLELEQLYAEISRLHNSIYHLERSNVALAEYQDDLDCKAAIEENEVTVNRQKERVGILLQEVENRGFGRECGDAGAYKINVVNGAHGSNGTNVVNGRNDAEHTPEEERVDIEVRDRGARADLGTRENQNDETADGNGGVHL